MFGGAGRQGGLLRVCGEGRSGGARCRRRFGVEAGWARDPLPPGRGLAGGGWPETAVLGLARVGVVEGSVAHTAPAMAGGMAPPSGRLPRRAPCPPCPPNPASPAPPWRQPRPHPLTRGLPFSPAPNPPNPQARRRPAAQRQVPARVPGDDREGLCPPDRPLLSSVQVRLPVGPALWGHPLAASSAHARRHKSLLVRARFGRARLTGGPACALPAPRLCPSTLPLCCAAALQPSVCQPH